MNKEKWVIGVDLDGTTVTSKDKHDVSDFTIEVFNKMAQLGHKIVITTGRTYEGSRQVYEKIGLDHMMINQAGGYIHNPSHEEEPKISTPLNMEVIKKIIFEDSNISKYVASFILDGAYESFVNNLNERIDTIQLVKRAIRKTNNKEYSFDNEQEKILSGNIIFDIKTESELEELISYLESNYGEDHHYTKWSVHQDGFQGIEINPSSSSKGKAILKVAEIYDFPKENTMGFGDGENDIELIKLTNVGVAMKNSYDGLKEIANEITEYDNDHDGIAHFLIKKFNLDI